MIAEHAPMLLVLAPLAAALLVSLLALRRLALAHALACAGALAAAVVSWGLLADVVAHGGRRYAIGGWPPPWGIELHVDRLGAFVAAVVASMGTLSLLWSRPAVQDEIGRRGPVFYAVAPLCLCGLLGMCVTGDAFNLFVFLEVSSLTGYALVGAGGGRSQVAAFRYLLLGSTGASLYLLGVGYLYVSTGTLNMADLAARVPGNDLAPIALAFVLAGLSLKAGLFPLHGWMPDAYAESPRATAAFVAPIVTKVMAFALVRFLVTVFGAEVFLGPVAVGTFLAGLGAVAALVGAAVAAAQVDYRRLLAWSSVGQIGYIAIGVGLGTRASVAAALLHVLNHALMKGTLFYVAGSARIHAVDDLRGLSRRMPATAVCLALAGASLVGIPPLGGFFSKWYLLQAALDAGQPLLAAAIVGGSLLGLLYVFRLVEAAFLKDPGEAGTARREAPLSMLLPQAVAALAIVAAGLLSARIMDGWLLGGGA